MVQAVFPIESYFESAWRKISVSARCAFKQKWMKTSATINVAYFISWLVFFEQTQNSN
jgi:hypothetical protein